MAPAYLTLVLARVLLPGVLQLQYPGVSPLLVQGAEPLIRGVGNFSDREDLEICHSHPGNLKNYGHTFQT